MEIYQKLEAEEDLYNIFGVAKDCTKKEIQRRYYKLALQYHPDKNTAASAALNFQAIGKIYDILKDDKKRATYDRTGQINQEGFTGVDWESYCQEMFQKVTVEEIERYFREYEGSKEEEDDLIQAYEEYKGDVLQMMDFLPFAEPEREYTIRTKIDGLLEEGKIEPCPQYTPLKDWKQKDLQRIKRKSTKRKQKNTMPSTDLVAQIRGKRSKLASTVADLEAKYT